MYEYFKKQSEKIDFACESYTNYSMAKRNRALVDNADYCIAYCTKSTGGTVYTLNYAIGKGIDFINLASEIKKSNFIHKVYILDKKIYIVYK